jgi:formate hydrogenlyase subunit 3/multisubunit Na+/H+ antiporter MnhD subunit
MGLIGDLLGYLILEPFFAFFKVFAGIMTPTDNRRLVRIKWIAVVLLLLGVIGMLTGLFGFSFVADGSSRLFSIVAGVVSVVVAGALGEYVEKQATKQLP